MRFLGAGSIFDVPVYGIPGTGSDVLVLEGSQSEAENRAGPIQARSEILPEALGRTRSAGSCRIGGVAERHPVSIDSPFVFPSPTGNREQNFLRRCKLIAERAGLDPEEFDLKTFRSTYATSMLRRGFDVRTVQHWMGHKSLETTVIWRPRQMFMIGSI